MVKTKFIKIKKAQNKAVEYTCACIIFGGCIINQFAADIVTLSLSKRYFKQFNASFDRLRMTFGCYDTATKTYEIKVMIINYKVKNS
ncbi:hypothetical protein ASE92_19200 [Pedobacter sp. Leaf41]|nr:hypothetical protein ASE92_19200 [Pedobacter sp. Leaf41]